MAEARDIAILNGLLAATQNSPLCHLVDSVVFPASAAADEVEAVQNMVREERAQGATLAELILDLRGAPRPAAPDPHAADLHYLEFHYLLAGILRAKELLLARFEAARVGLAGSPAALEVVTRLGAQQRRHVETLRELVKRSVPAPAQPA